MIFEVGQWSRRLRSFSRRRALSRTAFVHRNSIGESAYAKTQVGAMEIDSSSRHISAKPDAKHQAASSFSMARSTLLFVGFIFDGVAGAATDSRLQSSNAN
jgi:hypothetical protein